MLAGVAGGFLAGVLLAGALAGFAVHSAIGQQDLAEARARFNQQPASAAGSLAHKPPMADIAPFAIYSLTTFTTIGAVLGLMSRRDWRIRPLSGSFRVLCVLPAFLLWGPLLGFLGQRIERAREPKQAERPAAQAGLYGNIVLMMTSSGALQFSWRSENLSEGGLQYDMQNRDTTKKVGESGGMYSDSLIGISATVAWPASRTFEVTVDYDPKTPHQKLFVMVHSFLDVEAKLDEARVGLPVELPPGKHRLVIRGRCPERDLRGAALPAQRGSRPGPASEKP